MQRWKFGWLAVAGASMLAVGCAHGPPPDELTAARRAYHEVARSPEGRERPADVAAARSALQEAENEYVDSHGSTKTRSLAYVALRKAEIAQARGEADLAARQQAQAEATLRQRQESRLQQLTQQQQEERARYEQQRSQYEEQRQQYEAQRAQDAERMRTADAQQRQQMEDQLQQRTQELEQERLARQQAEQKASQELARLQDRNLKVREEARGTVVTLSGSVLFATNATELLPAARDRLSDVATALKETQSPLIIEGHTDSRGTEQYNEQLSERRAESVKDFLVAQGVPEDRVRIRGLGEEKPVASNATAEGRANNRRVEIVVERNVAGAQPSRTGGVGGSGEQQPVQGDEENSQGAQPGGTGGSGEQPRPHDMGTMDHQGPAPDQGTGGSGAQQVPEQPLDHGGQ